MRTSRAELTSVIEKLQDELKKARRETEELKLKIASGAIGSSASNGDEARDINGVKVLAKEASGLDAAGMRQLSDTLLDRIKSGVVVIGRANDGKVSLIVRTSDDLTKRVPAGQVIKELAPIIGGKGGGKADMAEGGGSQPEKLSEASSGPMMYPTPRNAGLTVGPATVETPPAPSTCVEPSGPRRRLLRPRLPTRC